MLEDMLTTFTDRREGIAIFELLRKREPHQFSWPLSPILSFIAPGGGGKSTLIEYLITARCCKDGRAILPYAHIDFTKAVTLRDLLSILIELRDQFHAHTDEQGKRLTFPRFDLGAAIAMNAPLGSQLPRLKEDDIRHQLKYARSAFHALHEMGTAYWSLPAGDRAENLAHAIACYQAALQVFQLTRMDYYIPIVSRNLKAAKDELSGWEET